MKANNDINTTIIYINPYKYMIPKELQHTEKKLICFTKQQKEAFETLEKYGVNISQFIRQAVREKIKREWKEIKDKKDKIKLPF